MTAASSKVRWIVVILCTTRACRTQLLARDPPDPILPAEERAFRRVHGGLTADERMRMLGRRAEDELGGPLGADFQRGVALVEYRHLPRDDGPCDVQLSPVHGEPGDVVIRGRLIAPRFAIPQLHVHVRHRAHVRDRAPQLTVAAEQDARSPVGLDRLRSSSTG